MLKNIVDKIDDNETISVDTIHNYKNKVDNKIDMFLVNRKERNDVDFSIQLYAGLLLSILIKKIKLSLCKDIITFKELILIMNKVLNELENNEIFMIEGDEYNKFKFLTSLRVNVNYIISDLYLERNKYENNEENNNLGGNA